MKGEEKRCDEGGDKIKTYFFKKKDDRIEKNVKVKGMENGMRVRWCVENMTIG